MIQKVLATVAFTVKPKVLIMDEPMAEWIPRHSTFLRRKFKGLQLGE